MLFDMADYYIHEYFIQSAVPTLEDFQITLNIIEKSVAPLGLIAIKSLTGLHPTRATTVIAELVEQGYLKKESVNGRQVYTLLPKKQDLDLSRYNTQQLVKTKELSQIVNYAKHNTECRMVTLRKALGDGLTNKCLHCDFCQMDHLRPDADASKIAAITTWIDARPVVIAANVKDSLSEGLSIFDSKRRSPIFVRFMKERNFMPTCSPDGVYNMDLSLLEAIKFHLLKIAKKESIAAICLVPSRTWAARDIIAKTLAESIKVPLLKEKLSWNEVPLKRQGELLNNDQRRDNVKGRMQATVNDMSNLGTILLFDDYIGSGATVREAMRALRVSSHKNKVIPFTIAQVKWHLGKPGFI